MTIPIPQTQLNKIFERRIVNFCLPISYLSIRVSSSRGDKCNCKQNITSLSLLVSTTVQYKQLEMFIIYHWKNVGLKLFDRKVHVCVSISLLVYTYTYL